MARRLILGLAVCVVAGILGAPANAARPALPHSLTAPSTPDVVVHYTSDTLDPAYATFTQASDLAVRLEGIYKKEIGYGYRQPLDDGDGKIDVYLGAPSLLVLGQAVPDNPAGPTSSGYILLPTNSLEDTATIAHELFHLIQFAYWVPTLQTDTWLFEGSAEWMGAKVDGFGSADVAGVGPNDLPLDCRENLSDPPYQMCSGDLYVERGYSRWPFFQSLAARYGTNFLQDVLTGGAGGLGATAALAGAIGAKGGTLTDVYGDWANQQLAGGYGIASLDALRPTPSTTISTGVNTTDLPSVQVSVDHLATRYVAFTRGDGSGDHPCFAALLTVSVAIQSGVTSRPALWWDAKGSTIVPLTGTGSTVSATIPWDTCRWAGQAAYLALPNATTAVNAAVFTVTTSLLVDPKTPAGPTAPPVQGPVYGGVTAVASADTPPGITLFGPLLLQVSAQSPQLRLIVESTGDGKVHAMLGSVDLGSPAVRAGNNDLRFKLPKSLLSSLRIKSAAGNVLTLTPLSPSGAVTGTAVTRNVAVAAKPKVQKKKH